MTGGAGFAVTFELSLAVDALVEGVSGISITAASFFGDVLSLLTPELLFSVPLTFAAKF